MRLIIISAVLLGLPGCGDQPTQQQAPANRQIAVRSPEQDRLHQLDTMARDIGLKRAIQDSGVTCKRVVRSGYVQEYNQLSMWSAECGDKRQWAIFVGADGSAQVRPCGDMTKFNLPECRIAADPTGRTARGLAQPAAAESNAQ
ncbi:hypothetical protein OMW55_00390 [Sphingomonas sp. BN140010]|uniref:Uncharacterized protein n=1 Tax=Sphingomonas arvum TaxID=2992113 RepID=A0ABT3JB33_9SPHN|nr:hypothetical protein [Sphingomonas sp. BN140010]MCW3796268.1 hypothetical protein [Sphingomonas sp. BN140010]